MLAQTILLRQPAVRIAFRIPLIPARLRVTPPTMRESAQYARKWWRGKMDEAREAQRALDRRR